MMVVACPLTLPQPVIEASECRSLLAHNFPPSAPSPPTATEETVSIYSHYTYSRSYFQFYSAHTITQ